MPLELQRQLIQIIAPHLGLIHPRRDRMMSISRCPNFITRFGELELLNEVNSALDVLLYRAFALLCDSFSGEPVRKRRRGSGCRAVHSVHLDVGGVCERNHGLELSPTPTMDVGRKFCGRGWRRKFCPNMEVLKSRAVPKEVEQTLSRARTRFIDPITLKARRSNTAHRRPTY